MRLWSLHPQSLDPKGLVALWREALLAQIDAAAPRKPHPLFRVVAGGAAPWEAVSR